MRELDAQLAQETENTGIPGASAAIVFPDGRVWAGAAGLAVLEPPRRMTTGTSLPFDSVTKVFTAALAMKLVEAGRLDLDEPVRQRYPAWRGDPRATVRDLLGHTSGAKEPPPEWGDRVLRSRRRVTPAQVIRASGRPGPRSEEAEYSNPGFNIAGKILARAAGAPVSQLLRTQLLNEPGGEGLAFQPAERPRAPLAHTYWYPHGLADPVDTSDGTPFVPNARFAAMASTAGAIGGTVPSLARWGHQLLGGHILEPASLREMTKFHAGAWQGYGLGLARDSFDGREAWGHGGDGLGSHTEFWHLRAANLTIVTTWNDDALDREGQILSSLLRVVLPAQ
jgi:D-alanyl-D-alanine carboxypeptidase